MPLISRSTFPPQGWWVFFPATNWPPMDQAQSHFAGKTGDQVVDEMVAHALANPQHKLPATREEAWAYLDFFTCARLKFDPNYCLGGPGGKAPSPLRPSGPAGASAKNLAAAVVKKALKYVSGIGVLLDWLGSGGKAVEPEQSAARALVCADCPKNQPGDWESFFTGMAAEKIRQQLGVRQEMKLSTPLDDRLNVCEACLCHLKLKVHVPIEHVLKKLKPEMKAELDPRCWILREM